MDRLDRYTCEEAFRRLDDFVDRELPPGEMDRVRQHVDTCAACAAEFRFEQAVLAEVRGKLGRIRAPEGMMERIAARLAAAG